MVVVEGRVVGSGAGVTFVFFFPHLSGHPQAPALCEPRLASLRITSHAARVCSVHWSVIGWWVGVWIVVVELWLAPC
jgi:hypothetical protein